MKLLRGLSDADLLAGVERWCAVERRAMSAVLWHLAEMDLRWARMNLAYPSLFAYCTKRLGYSEAAAFKRVYAARIAARFPEVLEMLDRGETHLTALLLLGPHLNSDNRSAVLAQARHKSKREIEFLAASLAPRPDVPDSVRPVSVSGAPAEDVEALFAGTPPPGTPIPPSPWSRMAERSVVEPWSQERIRFAFTGGKGLLELVERARQILRHKYPAGQLEGIFEDALEALLDKKDPDRRQRRLAETKRRPPDPAACDPFSRRIPQGVRDEVWRRDGGRCAHVDPEGARCPERGGLEFDHVVPHALGGPSNNPKNIRLLCRAHNRAASVRFFGDAATRHWTRPQ